MRFFGSVIIWVVITAAAAGADNPNYPKPGEVFADDAALGSLIEIHIGTLAQERAAGAEVKEFGKKLVRDHLNAIEELKRVVAPKGFELPDQLSKEDKDGMAHLSQFNGELFDEAFISETRKTHKLALREFQKEANYGHDPEIKAFAASKIPVLQEQLRIADDLDQKIPKKISSGVRAR